MGGYGGRINWWKPSGELNIGADRLDNLVSSMPGRLEAVIAAGGNATPY